MCPNLFPVLPGTLRSYLPDVLVPQQQTHEQRQVDGNLPYEITRGSTKKKLQRVSQMQKGTEQPHVWRVLQDSIADSCVIVLFLVFGF